MKTNDSLTMTMHEHERRRREQAELSRDHWRIVALCLLTILLGMSAAILLH